MLNSENRNLAASARTTSKRTSKYCSPLSESTSIKAAVVLLGLTGTPTEAHWLRCAKGYSAKHMTTWAEKDLQPTFNLRSTWHQQNARFWRIHPGTLFITELQQTCSHVFTAEYKRSAREREGKWQEMKNITTSCMPARRNTTPMYTKE